MAHNCRLSVVTEAIMMMMLCALSSGYKPYWPGFHSFAIFAVVRANGGMTSWAVLKQVARMCGVLQNYGQIKLTRRDSRATAVVVVVVVVSSAGGSVEQARGNAKCDAQRRMRVVTPRWCCKLTPCPLANTITPTRHILYMMLARVRQPLHLTN